MATEEERLAAVVEGMEALEGRLVVQEGLKRVYAELAEKKIMSYRMVKVPKDYYDLTMDQRSQCLAPCSVPQMCKSIVFENVSWDGDKSLPMKQQMADATNSRYYLLVVQYNAKFSADKLRLFVTGLRPASDPTRLTRSRCNFQLAGDGEELTGFFHNAVCPFGLLNKIPVVLSTACVQVSPRYLYMGGGAVNIKLGMTTADLLASTAAVVGDVSEPREGVGA